MGKFWWGRISANHTQGRSQEFQKGVSINGRMSIKQGSVGVQLQMLYTCKLNTFLPNKSM